jgi:hypothetical protein
MKPRQSCGLLPVVATASAQPAGPRKSLHALLTCESIQSSLQLGVGMFVACLFTYVLPISFPPMSCVVATWLCVVGVMASPANHLGVRVTSASNVLGGTCVGAVLGATVVSRFSRQTAMVSGRTLLGDVGDCEVLARVTCCALCCPAALCCVTQVTLSELVGPAFSAQSTAVLGVLAPAVLAVLAPAR